LCGAGICDDIRILVVSTGAKPGFPNVLKAVLKAVLNVKSCLTDSYV